jgi:purine-binding chemotaxis protein CheW
MTSLNGIIPKDPEIVAVLRERARRLAAPPPEESGSSGRIELVVFRLGGETYAVESRYVQETAAIRSLTPLPGVPAFVAGITNLRGEVVSIMNLRAIFDLPTAEGGAYVLYLRAGLMSFGIQVDAIQGVRDIGADEMRPDLGSLAGSRGRYIGGVTADCIAVLDAYALLTDERLIVRDA